VSAQAIQREKLSLYSIANCSKASGYGGEKFVTLNAGSDAAASVKRFDAEHSGIAANMYVTGKRNLLGKRENELDRTPGFDGGFHQKVESPEADVARFTPQLRNPVARLEADFYREHH
jgi:hypothetical protein